MVKIIKDLSFEEPFLDLSQFKGQKIEITVLEIHDLSSRISSDQVQIEDKKKTFEIWSEKHKSNSEKELESFRELGYENFLNNDYPNDSIYDNYPLNKIKQK
ncbi:MAG: hypothetical protein ACK481_07960 [Candidatus Melainabacteria bacterium]|jgi:hypothetical protein